MLRSILWAATDNLKRATRWASGVGQVVAWLFIIIGVAMALGVQIPFFGTGFINGLWLAFIGWFLNSASIQSYQQVLVQDLLEGVPVGRIMRQQPPTVPVGSSISELVHNYVMRSDDHAFPVEDQEGRFVGLITLEDMRKVEKADWDVTAVQNVMTPAQQLVTARVEEDADEALRKLSQRDVRQLPVLQGGELAGILRRRDIMRWLQLQEV
ncbi:MAG: CBS domain-containing protein [Caldilineaceae bacterium]